LRFCCLRGPCDHCVLGRFVLLDLRSLGSLAGITILGTILTAVYTNTIHLPATAPARTAGSIDQARAAAAHLPAGQARTLLAAAASAFDNGYTLALAITAIALAAGSAFTYRYLKRQPTTPTEQARRPRTGPARRVAAAAPTDVPGSGAVVISNS